MEGLPRLPYIALLALASCGRIGFDSIASDAVDAGAGNETDADTMVDASTRSLVPDCEWVVDSVSDLNEAAVVQGQVLDGVVFFSLRCREDTQRASLWFEDEVLSRVADNLHESAPYDLENNSGSIVAIDLSLVHSGEHSLTAWLDFQLDGLAVQVETATFVVASTAQPQLVVSTSPLRENPVPLAGQNLSGLVYISLQPGMRLEDTFGPVEFFIDSVSEQTESSLPFDLGGGDNFFGMAGAFNLDDLAVGIHTIEAHVGVGDNIEIISASIVVL